MRQRVFGDAVTAGDFEALAPDVGPTDFVRLCGALVGAALADRTGAFTLPEITERITVPDGGVDALYVAPPLAIVSESGGLVGPGTTVYQFQYRDVRRGRRGVVTELAATRDEFAKVAGGCDRYVLLTNVDLSRYSRARLRQQFLDACPAFSSKTLVIWGASDLATAINLVPQLRHLFISGGRLCTFDVAEQEHRALWERRGWPGLVGRQRELEAIESFMDSRDARVLRLAGMRHSGKTRLALEALGSRATQVVRASSPESATIELFRDLDEGGRSAVLVVDGCTRQESDDIAELARARRHLKTLVLEEGGEATASLDQPAFLLRPLDEVEARQLVAEVTPGLTFAQASWIVEAAGGLPGLLVEIAALVREVELEPTGRPGKVRHWLGARMEHLYLSPIAGDVALCQALGVLSLLPDVGVDGNVGSELDALCRALGVNVDEIRSRIGILVRHGLVRRRGRFVEVIPPGLAERLAGETLGRPNLRVAELLAALEPSTFVRFLRRLRDLARPEVAGTIEQLLRQWFSDPESVIRNARVLGTLAPAAPMVGLRCLEHGLGTLSPDDLRERLAGDARREIVEALAPLAHLPETFEGASRLLLLLAEAENERWANNATGEFVGMFAVGHPEVSVSLAQRAAFLGQHARSPSPERRRLISRACGEGLSPRSIVSYRSHAGPDVPRRPALPTWGELWSYQSSLLNVARRLSEDADPGVRGVATDAIVDGFGDVVHGTMTRERLEEPGVAAFEALRHVARSTDSARVLERAVTRLEVLLHNLKKQQTDAGAALADVSERVSGLLRELTEGGLKDELWRWVGPRSQHVLELEVASDDEPSRRLQQVARRFSEDLSQLSVHLPWLLGEEAEKRTAFFEALGEALAESGQAESGVDLLTAHVDSPIWPQAVGGFCLGWARHDPARVETALDGLLEVSGTWKGVLVASAWLLPSRAAMRRLGKLVERADATRVEGARELAWSVPWHRLEADEAAQLLHTIDDGSREVRAQLLVALGRGMSRDAELSPGLLELSWSFLESTVAETRESGGHTWDVLASRLVATDHVRVLALLKTALSERLESVERRFKDAVPLTWSRLVSKDRAGLVRVMLEAMLGRDPSITASWALRGLVRPLEDRDTLLVFVDQAGGEGARLVAGALEAGDPGFWKLAQDLLAMSGGDQGVQAGLNRSVLSGTWSGSAIPWIESRLTGARELAAAPDTAVSSWARRMVSTLERWRMKEEQTDDEPWIWETRMQRREVEGLLARGDSPERLWAIGRLLADAPAARVRELLSADEILDALPRLSDVPEKKLKEWETWARHWSGRH